MTEENSTKTNKEKPMNRKQNLFALLTIAAACATMALSAVADDAKPSATGTWTWNQPGRNGGPDRTNTLTLKADDAKLTGKLSMPGRGASATPIETDITDGKVDGDSVSFAVVREFNGNSMTNTYTGKVTADAITGKVAGMRNGEPTSRDWTAKRSTDAK
jgi:hypothetical protein